MQKKPAWLPFAILSWLLISAGCATTPPDIPACEHLSSRVYTDPKTGHDMLEPSPACFAAIGEMECGHCVWIMSGKEAIIGEKPGTWFNGKPWSKLKEQSVYMPAEESYAPLAAYAINACKKMNCSNDVNRFKVKLNSLKATTK